jgi:ORF6N domain
MFQLNKKEFASLTSQFAISKKGRGGRRTLPFVFTKQGVAMLSSVLNSERAIQVKIVIMRAFVKLRQLLESNEELNRKFASVLRKLAVV